MSDAVAATRKNLLRALAVCAGAFALDRAAKQLALDAEVGRAGMELGPFVRVVEVWNTGINFGLFSSDSETAAYVLAAFAVFAAAAFLVWGSQTSDRFRGLGCGAVAGGAIGNAFDRLAFGAVHDYLNVSCCGIRNPYAFNLADAAIVLGVLAIVIRR